MYGNKLLEYVNEYKNLGIYFRSSGVFTQGIIYLCNKALKAIFCIRKALMSDCMNTGLYVTLYNHSVKLGERTGLVVRASDSKSGDRGSILGRVGVLFP